MAILATSHGRDARATRMLHASVLFVLLKDWQARRIIGTISQSGQHSQQEDRDDQTHRAIGDV